MKNNAVMPYIVIMVLGLTLVFFLSIKGIGDADKMAKEKEGNEKTEETASNDKPEDIYKNQCLSCHGGNYEGGAGPKLVGLKDKELIKDRIVNGKGMMPGGLVPEDKVDEMVEFIAGLE